MAPRGLVLGLFMVLLVAIFSGHGLAQSSCTVVLISLAPCLSYIMGNSSTPATSCCSQLATVAQSQPQCLCTILNGGAALPLMPFGIMVNQTQALALPGACQVPTPPVSQCNAAGPASSPAEAPVPTSPAAPSTPSGPSNPSSTTPSNPAAPTEPSRNSTPSLPSTPAGNGSKTTPTTTRQSSAGSSTTLSLSLFFSLIFIASYASSAGPSF